MYNLIYLFHFIGSLFYDSLIIYYSSKGKKENNGKVQVKPSIKNPHLKRIYVNEINGFKNFFC